MRTKMEAIQLLAIVVQKMSFPCIVLKSREQLNNCKHPAFVVHV